MDMYIAWIIVAIFFWVLCAIGIIMGMAYIFIQIQYYHWDKEERNKNAIVKELTEKVKQTLEELDAEQYASNFDEVGEDIVN